MRSIQTEFLFFSKKVKGSDEENVHGIASQAFDIGHE